MTALEQPYEATGEALPDTLAFTDANPEPATRSPSARRARNRRAYEEGEIPSKRALSRTVLAGRVAVVAGASGIGRALGEMFGCEGTKVVLADVEAGTTSRPSCARSVATTMNR